MGARKNYQMEKDEFFLLFVFHLRKKQLLPSFSEGIANNGGERKTRDAKPSPAINSPAINSPVWAAGLPQPSSPVTLCQLAPGSAFPLPALPLQARVPPVSIEEQRCQWANANPS